MEGASPHAGPPGLAARIDDVRAQAFRFPTDLPEADGTLSWNQTTLVVVELQAGGITGLGYTYGAAAIAPLVRELWAPRLRGRNGLDTRALVVDLAKSSRNVGRGGLVAMGLSAVDAALWDLKGRCLGVSVARLLGPVREEVPIYGSGGFTSYSIEHLQAQLGAWADQGIPRVKMKIGSHPDEDPARVAAAREAIGPSVELFVDANGAYTVEQALRIAGELATSGVRWLEEPVSSEDLAGLARIAREGPWGMAVAAGEYGDSPVYFERMLGARSVDVLQADATRCLGVTGFMDVDALCEGFEVPLSAHCAPSLHAQVGVCARRLVHLEYFHDHVRLEQQLFEGAARQLHGALRPDLSVPGLGLSFKWQDAARYAVG